MNKSMLLLSLLAVIWFSACEIVINDCIRGNGKQVTEERFMDGFNQVQSNGFFDVVIHHDSIHKVFVTADENLLPHIETYKTGGKLVVGSADGTCINTRNKIEIEVYAPAINAITLWGSGEMLCDTFANREMEVTLFGSGHIDFNTTTGMLDIINEGSGSITGYSEAGSVYGQILGSGEINLRGKANTGNFKVFGSGWIDGYNLLLDTCYASNSGSGSIRVFVSEYLEAQVMGSGNIYYKGYPGTVIREDYGSGDIVNRN